MALSKSTKIRLILGLLLVVLGVGVWQGLSYAWSRGYAQGTVTGYVRKVSVHGPPYCRVLTGELIYQGASRAGQADLFHFSVDDESDANPVVADLKDAERSGRRVTLDYRQDLKILWRCNRSENFITAVEK